jgi:hypothetical protein
MGLVLLAESEQGAVRVGAAVTVAAAGRVGTAGRAVLVFLA